MNDIDWNVMRRSERNVSIGTLCIDLNVMRRFERNVLIGT